MRNLFETLLAVFVTAAVAGCDGPRERINNTVLRPGNPGVTTVDDENPKMKEAISQAQKTVDQFINALQQPPADSRGFSIKVKIEDGDKVEFMWLVNPEFQDGKFSGVIGNEPLDFKTIKIGQEHTVSKGEIVDWMYLKGSTLVGGFTTRALRELMTPEEQAEFDREVPFKLD